MSAPQQQTQTTWIFPIPLLLFKDNRMDTTLVFGVGKQANQKDAGNSTDAFRIVQICMKDHMKWTFDSYYILLL